MAYKPTDISSTDALLQPLSWSSVIPTTNPITPTTPLPQTFSTPTTPTITPTTITPESLTPTQPTPITNPAPTPIYPVSTLQPPVIDTSQDSTSQETKASGISTLLQSLIGQDANKATDQNTANQQYGVLDAQKNIADLSAQLTSLKNEAAAIPLQIQNNGIGDTQGYQDNQIQAQLKTNAIRALGVSTLLATSQGQLANAQDMANQAVAQKYGPIEAQITAQKANLDLILNDPLTKTQDANRARAQKDIQDKKTALIEQKKADMATIMSWAAAALHNDPAKAGYTAQQIMAIATSDNPDLNAALKLYAPFAVDPNATAKAVGELQAQRDTHNASVASTAKTIKETNALGSGSKVLSPTEAQTLGVPYGTTEAQAQAMGKTPKKAPTAVQETTALYANRLEQSGKILDSLDSYAMSSNPLSYYLQKGLPGVLNTLKSGNFQSVDQAQRNFVNAVLRRESGAVISPSEFDNASKQYFAQPGDAADTVAQKKANRDLVINGFIQGSGDAYTPITQNAVAPSTPPPTGQIWITRNGVTGSIPQGEFDPKTDKKL